MGWKTALSLILIMLVLIMLVVYWFVPISTTEFVSQTNNDNLGIGNLSISALQFYSNMRFSKSDISFKIYDCPLQKRSDMERAFSIVSEKTSLVFRPFSSNEEISVHCDSSQKIEEGLFIAGEGGPVNITKSGEFNVISKGNILLFRQSSCPNPNVAIHELFHALGFDHVDNEADIMYPVSKCGQEINPLMIDMIDEIYAIPNYPDLAFEDVSAVMNGKYLNVNMSVRNQGLKESIKAIIRIYVENSVVKEIDLDSLEIGHGRIITLTNIWIKKISVDEVSFEIDLRSQELKKENNRASLVIKE